MSIVTVASKLLNEFRSDCLHVEKLIGLAIPRCFSEKTNESVVSLYDRFADIESKSFRLTFLLEIREEIRCLG